MWRFAVPVDGRVSFGMMPLREHLDEVARDFDAVAVLVEDCELPYSLDEWEKRGVEVLHSPVPDFKAPTLDQLLETLRWIEEMVREGKRVLIHCSGGMGRSGTVATAWLMYSRGLPLVEAIRRVRSLRPGAVETPDQVGVLRELERYMSERQ